MQKVTMDNNPTIKKTLGRRKIEIRKIEKKSSLQVTFTKRRMGLLRKASELSVVCGADIAIFVQSPADKLFTFGNPSVESVIHRFETGSRFSPDTNSGFIGEESRVKYAEAVKKLEGEIKMEKRVKELDENMGSTLWWEKNFEGMELHELEEYVEALEDLRDNVMKQASSSSTSSNLLTLTNYDHDSYNPQFNEQDFNNFAGRQDSVEVVRMDAGQAQTVEDEGVNTSASFSNFLMNPTDNGQGFEDFYYVENPSSFCNL